MKIKIGILGLANISEKYIIQTIQSLKDKFKLVGIATTKKSNIKKIEGIYNVKSYLNYNDLLNDEIDAVYIPLPNSLHFSWAKKALEKNLHVIVEKPMTLNAKDCKELYEIATKNNVVLIENFQFRFHNQLKCIREIIRSGKIGNLKKINSSFCFNLSDKKNIRFNKSLGGGAFYDTGVYPLKIVQLLLGNNLSVEYSKFNYDKKFLVENSGSFVVTKSQSEIVCNLSFGFENFYQCSIELCGDKGRIYTNRIFTCPPNVKAEIELHSKDEFEKFLIPLDNHFENIFVYFHNMISQKKDIKKEMTDNIYFYEIVDQIILMSNKL